MFTGSKHSDGAGASSEKQHKDYDFSAMYPVCSGRDILKAAPYQQKISQLESWSLLAHEGAFQELFLPVLTNYAEFVQMLPDARENNRPLLHVALSRCMASMQKSANSAMPPRVQYAIFSASLMLQLGMVHTDYKVMLSNDDGAYLSEWSPFFQFMTDTAAPFYKIRPTTGHPPILLPTVTPILAQKLLPLSGFEWIAEDPVLLIQWVNALSRRDETGLLGQVLDSAEDLQADFLAEFDDIVVQSEHAEATQLGEAYWQWLKKQVAQGQYAINGTESPLVMTEAGLLMDHQVLAKAFLKAHRHAATSGTVVQQFNQLGIAPLDGAAYQFQQGGQSSSPAHSQTTSMFGVAKSQESAIGKRAVAGAVARSLSGQLLHHKGMLTYEGKIAGVAKDVRATQKISAADRLSERLAIRFSGKRQISPSVQGK